MSSDGFAARLNSDELAIIQRVLSDAGYTGDVMVTAPADFNAAAKLLIGLFKRGLRGHADLTAELQTEFGHHRYVAQVEAKALHRHAIRGLLTKRP